MRKIILLFTLMLLINTSCFSQNKVIDSLKTALQNARNDTTRLETYLALGNACERKDNMLYAEPAFTIADKLLTDNIDIALRDKILQQEAAAYSLVIAYYTTSSSFSADRIMPTGSLSPSTFSSFLK